MIKNYIFECTADDEYTNCDERVRVNTTKGKQIVLCGNWERQKKIKCAHKKILYLK